MKQNISNKNNDPMGAAIWDYHKNGKSSKLIVKSSMFDDDTIPLKVLFRTFNEMSEIEKTALKLANGKILDIGGGSGCHSLCLQEMGKDVTTIDISPLSIETMKERGVKKVEEVDFFSEKFNKKFDTIIMLMNGAGIIGKIDNLGDFFHRIDSLLSPSGALYIDSSDLKYLFEEDDGSFLIDINGDYYGEIDYLMTYKNVVGEPFDWLYIDADTFAGYAQEYGYKLTVIVEGEHYDYLAKIEKIKI